MNTHEFLSYTNLKQDFLSTHSGINDETRMPDDLIMLNDQRLTGKFSNVFSPRWISAVSEIIPQLKTGDLLLVHGKYPYSWVIEALERSKWTHCAMVVKKQDIDPKDEHKHLTDLMLWEANVDDQNAENLWISNEDTPAVKAGPMLVSFEQRLKNTLTYADVEIVWRPLHYNLTSDELLTLPDYFNSVINKGFPSDLEVIRAVYLGRRYNRSAKNPSDFLELDVNRNQNTIRSVKLELNRILDELDDKDVDVDKIYCSELLAATYKHLKLLTMEHVSNAYSPKDFSSDGSTQLLKRAFFGTEMYINAKK